MRYIITTTQLHKLVYKFLDDTFSKKDFRKEINPYVKDGNTWHIDMFDDKGKKLFSYFWYGTGGTWDDDDDTPHDGVGNLHVNPYIVDDLRSTLKVRESKILDIIGDWVSETLGVVIDDITIYPTRNKPPRY